MNRYLKKQYDLNEASLRECGIQFPDFENWTLGRLFDFIKKAYAHPHLGEKELLGSILCREHCEAVQMAKFGFWNGTTPDEPRSRAKKAVHA
jgi:hypothetical protein